MFSLISIVRPKNIKNLEMVFSAFITSNPVYQIIDSCIKFCNNVRRIGKGKEMDLLTSHDSFFRVHFKASFGYFGRLTEVRLCLMFLKAVKKKNITYSFNPETCHKWKIVFAITNSFKFNSYKYLRHDM